MKRDSTWPNVTLMRTTTVDGAKIANLRELAGMTQVELAAKLGLDRSAIAHWETGRKSPGAATFKRLCKALAVKPADLLVTPPAEGAA